MPRKNNEQGECSVSQSEVAFKYVKKAVEQDKVEGKLRLGGKGGLRKIFN